LESELANFANLHVASNCLHSTLSPSGVGRRIKEILEQLVGVDAYVIYLCRPELSPIAAEGLKPDDNLADAPMDRLSEVVHSGVSSINDDIDPSRGTVSQPSALIPLSIDDQVVGVLSIIRSLPHKRQLTNIDFELFKLLGQHAAAALMASGLYAQAGRVLPTPDAFGSLQH
jgi:GAF domain-containing protein